MKFEDLIEFIKNDNFQCFYDGEIYINGKTIFHYELLELLKEYLNKEEL